MTDEGKGFTLKEKEGACVQPPSSVTFGDSFPPEGSVQRWRVLPTGCGEQPEGGINAAPTEAYRRGGIHPALVFHAANVPRKL